MQLAAWKRRDCAGAGAEPRGESMRTHRFISMLHIAVRRCTEHRRIADTRSARLQPIRRKHVMRKRAS